MEVVVPNFLTLLKEQYACSIPLQIQPIFDTVYGFKSFGNTKNVLLSYKLFDKTTTFNSNMRRDANVETILSCGRNRLREICVFILLEFNATTACLDKTGLIIPTEKKVLYKPQHHFHGTQSIPTIEVVFDKFTG